MALPLFANAKTVKDDSQLFFAVTKEYTVPSASAHFLSPRDFNQLLRSRLQQRNRFNRDHHDTCMYIARSKNANVVAYTANLVDAETKESVESGIGRTCVLRKDDPIHPYFVNLEPSYVAERRRKGTEYDCDDLNLLERTLAYGVSAAPVNTEDILQYWGKKTPEGFAELVKEWRATGSAAVPVEEGHGSTDAPQPPAEGEGVNGGGKEPEMTSDSLESVLKTWWTPFHPYVSHFVALPTWPGLVLCLPPLAKSEGGSRHSSRSASPQSVTQTPLPGAASKPDVDAGAAEKTCTTYGTHTEPSPVTPTTGILADSDTVAVIVALIDNQLSVVEHVYVSSIEPKRFYQLPKVEYIEVHGVSLATGQPTYEKKSS